jgi:hypothetical protein
MKHRNPIRPPKGLVSSTAFCTMVVLASPLWAANPLPVVNAGFEQPVVGNEGSTGPAPTGWSPSEGATVNVLNPSPSDLSAEAPEGFNVAIVTSSALETGLSQTLTSPMQADASYLLRVKVANTLFTTGFPGYRVQLVADGTVLAEDDNSQVIAEDTVVTSTVNYTYNAGLHAGLVGKPLQIRLLSKGLVAGQEVAFDDVTLSVTLGSPLANAGGPYTVPISGSLSLNGGGSLPPDGQTLVSYEWDLNNDNVFGDATGVTPASITYADLIGNWAMIIGDNTIQLRVTDDSLPTPKSSVVSGIVKLSPPIGCQVGVLNLEANGGINPRTNAPWQAGDKYRLAFYTSTKRNAASTNINDYNDFVQGVAEASTAFPNLAKGSWRVLGSTQSVSARQNTFTDNLAAGVGEPVFVMNGATLIALDNADIWNGWSKGGTTVRTGTVHYSPYLNENGSGDSGVNHGVDCATGTNTNGTTKVDQYLGILPPATINWGSSNANNAGRVWNRFSGSPASNYSFYVLSYPMTVLNLSDNVDPGFVSITDNREGSNATLGLDTVVHTVSFTEGMNPATVELADFANGGTATATIDRVDPTPDPAVFKVTVTPTSVGTLNLQIAAAAVLEDFLGNALDTTSAIADDTTITVVADVTPPTLTSIEDNVSGGPILAFIPVTYTVTFNEGMNASSLSPEDFANSGSAPVVINNVTPTANPAVYQVSVTPTAAGDLTLAIIAGAAITDIVGNPLNTDAALLDDTTITIGPDPLPALVSITDNQSGGPVFATQSFTYLVDFDQTILPSSLDVDDFENAGSPAITVNAVARTSDPSVFAVHVTPGGAGAITLQIKAGAVITNVNGTAIDTTTPLADDTTMTVNAGSGPARGTITVDAVASFGANLGTLTLTRDVSGSDKLVVVVSGEHGNPGDFSGDSTLVTYDGVALTKVIDRNPIPGTPADQTFNDIWYLDNPATTDGVISATVRTRGTMTVFALSGTAPGVGQTAISPQASKSVVLSTGFANSLVIASHGMGGDGNTANTAAVNTVAPLIESSALSSTTNLWDGQVTGYVLLPTSGTATHAFTGGNTVGSHTIAAEFLAAAESVGVPPFGTWAAGFAGLTEANPGLDFDGGGLDTGIEWVVGGDPTDGGDDAGNAPTFSSGGPDSFVFTYKRRDAAQADPNTAILVQYSTNLGQWNPATNGVGGVTIDDSAVPEPGFRTMVVTIPKALAGAGDNLFARLHVVITP